MPNIRRVKHLELPFASGSWTFAQDRRADIEAHFATVRETKPEVWNGRVLLCRNPRVDGEVFAADYFETDFASFLAWRDWGFPDKTVFNSFGAGALRAADGAFVLGRMNAHTANAGRIYFPAGTPDPDDVAGNNVDLEASVARETLEEVGLSPADYEASRDWTVVESGQSFACFRLLISKLPAAELEQRIAAHLASQRLPELSGIKLVRDIADLDPAMPAFVRAYLEDALAPAPEWEK